MSSLPPARNLSRRSPLLLAAGLLLAATASHAQTIKSDRTMQDINAAEAAQAESLKALSGTGENGSFVDANGFTFGYRVSLPEGTHPGTTYPLYIHSGPPLPLSLHASQTKFPCYVVSVGCGAILSSKVPVPDWKERFAVAFRVIAEKVLTKYGNVDPTRIYTGGWSKCGGMSWMAVRRYPDFFAAVVPSAATCVVEETVPLIVSRKIGVWMFQGEKDGVFTQTHGNNSAVMATALEKAGGQYRYTQYPLAQHHILWTSDSPTNPKWNDFTTLREWLFQQKKTPAPWPIITCSPTAECVLGSPYTYQLTATNTPTSFDAQSLPPGLAVDPKTGLLSGTPTAEGTSFLTLHATNAKGTGVSTLMLTVKDPTEAHAPTPKP